MRRGLVSKKLIMKSTMTHNHKAFLFFSLIIIFRFQIAIGYTPCPSNTQTSSPCFPPPGYKRLPCAIIELDELGHLVSTSVLPPIIYGVNVCRVTSSVQVKLYSYFLHQVCSWRYYYYQYRCECGYQCLQSSVCSDDTRIETMTVDECCEGFAPRPPHPSDYIHQFYNNIFLPETSQPSGCPIAWGSTLLECLQIHNLTSFINLIMMATDQNITQLYNSSNSDITIFALTNEAINPAGISLINATDFILGHMLEGTFKSDQLTYSTTLNPMSMSIDVVHLTVVDHYYYKPYAFYPPNYRYGPSPYSHQYFYSHQDQYILLNRDRFINGAKIVNPDACMIGKGSLHIIDKPIPFPDKSLVNILESTSNFSLFKQALDAVGTTRFLDSSLLSHTVFAPVNSAFDELPPDLFDCLLRFDRIPLGTIVLYHISDSVEYHSSLRLRNWVNSRLGQYIQITLSDDRTNALLGSEKATILYKDISATDGVLHGIDRLLMPSNIHYNACQQFATLSSSPSPDPVPTPTHTVTSPIPIPSLITTSPAIMISSPSLLPDSSNVDSPFF